MAGSENYSEFQSQEKEDNSAILEREDSGNPFEDSVKKKKSGPSGDGNPYQEERRSSKRKKNGSRKLSFKSSEKGSEKKGDDKSSDRNLAKMAKDPSNTIMTAHHPKYSREKLEMEENNRPDMTQWNEKGASPMTSKPNIRTSTHVSNMHASDQKLRSGNKNSDNEFPAIKNSVVDESLPFQGLDNHTYHISQEGFSGARATYYNNPNNNFNPEGQNVMGNTAYNQSQTPNPGFVIPREEIASRKSSSILIKKLQQSRVYDEDNKPLKNETSFDQFNRFGPHQPRPNSKQGNPTMRSMQRITQPNNAYGNDNMNKSHNLIHKFQGISSSEYEGGHDITLQNNPGHKHSKSVSKAMKFNAPQDNNLSFDERRKLSNAMKYFENNPKSLLKLVPEDSKYLYNSKSQRKNHSKRGIVPPQSGHVEHKFANHARKKSHGEFRKSNRSINRHLLNPTVAQFDKSLDHLNTINHPKPATANEANFLEYNSPNFMPNIKKKVSTTMYKARMNALHNKANITNSISQQKETTIIGKKSIVIESETEEVVRDSQITQSQAIKMQNTINLVSDSESEASTRKRSKENQSAQKKTKRRSNKKNKPEAVPGMETHKRNKNSKIQDVVKEENQESDNRIERKEYKILRPESTQLEKIPAVGAQDPQKPSDEISKDISRHEKSVSDPVEEVSRKKSGIEEKKDSEIGAENTRQESPSNNTSLHKVNADEKSQKNPSVKNKALDENEETRRISGTEEKKGTKDEPHLNSPEKGQKESDQNVIYVKQKIESYRDSQHSQKLEEKQMEYTMKIGDRNKDEKSVKDPTKNDVREKQSNQHSFQPENSAFGHDDSSKERPPTSFHDDSSKERPPTIAHDDSSKERPQTSAYETANKDPDIYEVDLDTDSQKSKKSVAISAMNEDDLQSKKSAAISVMNEDDLQSKKSVAISVMKDDDLRSKKSVAISLQDFGNRNNTAKSSFRDPLKSKDELSKKSVALSVHPDKIPLHGDSKKSVACSADPDRVPVPPESKKDIALSVNTEKLNNQEDDKKSIALSMYTEKLYSIATKRTVALSVTPEKILRDMQEEENKIAEVSQEQEIDQQSEKFRYKSKKSIGLSISTKMGAGIDKSQTSVFPIEETKDVEDGFKPFVVKREQALSVITHTPTNREGPQSIALSAITHTPTEKSDEMNSVNLSALHLSQQEIEEDSGPKSYRSIALSAVKVYEPKNYIPPSRNRDIGVDQSQKYQTDKSIPAIERPTNEMAIGKSDYEGVADLERDDKSLDPKTIIQDDKSIGPKSYYQSEKSINPKSYYRSEKSINPKTVNQSEKSINPKSYYRSEKSINPKTVNQSEKSLNPRTIHQSEKSLNPKTINQSEKSINPKSIHRAEKSINPKSLHRSEKSLNPKTVNQTEKSIAPITDNKMNKSINPRSYAESREEEKYPKHRGKRRKHKHKTRKVDHQ